ncbi:hypothetical protein ACXZ1K_07770 [Pedobacter sp. PWIIR3]
MVKKKYVYLVGEQHEDPKEYIDAAFDSLQKAQAYRDRYKDSDAEIFVCEVNPEYHSDKTSNCYYVELTRDSDEPQDVMISNKMASAKMAVNDQIEVSRINGGGEVFGIYLFATSEEEAVERAIIRRDREG